MKVQYLFYVADAERCPVSGEQTLTYGTMVLADSVGAAIAGATQTDAMKAYAKAGRLYMTSQIPQSLELHAVDRRAMWLAVPHRLVWTHNWTSVESQESKP
jgi:hypothetical protein